MHRARRKPLLLPYVCPASVARRKRVKELLLKMIVEDILPFFIAEDTGFREFVRALDPSYAIPTRHFFVQRVARNQVPTGSGCRETFVVNFRGRHSDNGQLDLRALTELQSCDGALRITPDFHLGSCLLNCDKTGIRRTISA
jgi:hypothetical protein